MVAQLSWPYIRARPSKAVSRVISYAAFEGRPVTTRGRWINPIVLGLLGASKRSPSVRAVRKPIFIVGLGRSGSTILGLVLSLHREVGFLNEPKALWHSLHAGEDVVGSYSSGQAQYRLDAVDATAEMQRAAQRMYGAYLLLAGAQRVVDKYPELIFRIPFVKALFPDAHFLVLVRSAWDTCQSIERWSARYGAAPGGERHDWWGVNDRKWHLLVEQIAAHDPVLGAALPELRVIRDHRLRAAVEWTLAMRAGLDLQRTDPRFAQVVRYEDLVQRPTKTMADVLAFCDLHDDPVVLRFAAGVLRPPKPRGRFALPDWLEPTFEELMAELGYMP